MRLQTERIVRLEEEAGCFVLRTNVPTAGALAQSARDVLTVYKEQHGTEQHYGFLKDPVMVNSLFLQKPERIEALGLVVFLALLIWRWMERTMRTYVETTNLPLTGWDKQATERPTSFMMVTKCAGVIVVKLGDPRQFARPLSVVHQQYLMALNVPAACFTGLQSGEGEGEDCVTPLTVAEADSPRVGHRSSADPRPDDQQPPGVGPRPARRQGQYQPESPHVGSAGLDGYWPLGWWASRIPQAHPGGAAMGLAVCRKL